MISRDVIKAFCANPSRSDLEVADLSWLDDLISETRGEAFEGCRKFIAERTRPLFQYIVAFHACRPRSLDTFRKSGALAASREWLTTEARQIFGTTKEVECTIADAWQEAVGCGWHSHDGGKVWMFLHFDEGIYHCTHYCEYGSEWIQRVGYRLGRLDELARIGVPAIVEFAVPLVQCPNWESVAAEAVCEILRGEARLRPLRRQELCLKIHGNVAPEHIVKIHDLTSTGSNAESK